MLSNNKALRFKSVEEVANKAINQIEKLSTLPLRINQKIDAIRKFIIPSLDYILTNAEIYQRTINRIEKAIRKLVNQFVGNKGVLKDFATTNWKDGGLGVQPLREREKALRIKTLVALINIASDNTRKFMTKIIDEERIYRGIGKTDVNNSRFLDWETDEEGGITQNNTHGTDSIVIRAMRAAKELKVHITYDEEGRLEVYDTEVPGSPALVNPKEIIKKLMERTRAKKWENLSSHGFHGHTFKLTRDSRDSNYFIGNYSCRMSDKMMKFAIKGRLNLLPTGELLDKTEPNNAPHICNKCNNANIKDSLMHELNGCPTIRNKLTNRHNAVQNILKKEIENKYKVPVFTNSTIKINNRSIQSESGNLKPDLWYVHNGIINVIEFSIPYGEMKTVNGNEVNSLKETMKHKEEKYKDMVEEAKRTFNMNVEFYPIIVSSLGIIPKETISNIKKILHCPKNTTKKISRRMVYEAIRGSYLVFYNIGYNSRDGEETALSNNPIGSLRNEEPETDQEDGQQNQ